MIYNNNNDLSLMLEDIKRYLTYLFKNIDKTIILSFSCVLFLEHGFYSALLILTM